MPIVSTRYKLSPVQPNGTVRIYGECVDHTGEIHPVYSRILASEDPAVFMATKATDIESRLPRHEQRRFENYLERGGEPGAFVRSHTTAAQILRPLLRKFLETDNPRRALKMAKWLQANVTPAQIEAATNAAIRQKVISRGQRILAMETDLLADEADMGEVRG